MSKDRRDGYSVKPWDGRQAASGASRTALDALESAGLYSDAGDSDGRVPPSTSRSDAHETAKVRPSAAKAALPPSVEPSLTGTRQEKADPTSTSPKSRAHGREEPAGSNSHQKKKVGDSTGSSGRPKAGRTVVRTIRLTPRVDGYLRQLAEARGIDLNSAVSVAIAEDSFNNRSKVQRSP